MDHLVPRSVQADAVYLDTVLASSIEHGISTAIRCVATDATISKWQPTASLIANAAVFGLAALIGRPTPGQSVASITTSMAGQQGMQHGVSAFNTRRVVATAAMLLAQFGLAEMHRHRRQGGWEELPPSDVRYYSSILLDSLSAALSCAKLASAIMFLRRGDYGSLWERLGGLTVAFSQPLHHPRQSGTAATPRPQLFNIIALQVVIHCASELISSLRNAADWHRLYEVLGRIGNRVTRRVLVWLRILMWLVRARVLAVVIALRNASRRAIGLQPLLATMSSQSLGVILEQQEGRPKSPSSQPCALCGALSPVSPLRASCGHTYCYFCLHGGVLTHQDYECNRCGQVVTGALAMTVAATAGTIGSPAAQLFEG